MMTPLFFEEFTLLQWRARLAYPQHFKDLQRQLLVIGEHLHWLHTA